MQTALVSGSRSSRNSSDDSAARSVSIVYKRHETMAKTSQNSQTLFKMPVQNIFPHSDSYSPVFAPEYDTKRTN